MFHLSINVHVSMLHLIKVHLEANKLISAFFYHLHYVHYPNRPRSVFINLNVALCACVFIHGSAYIKSKQEHVICRQTV